MHYNKKNVSNMANSTAIHSHLASLHWPWSTNWRPAERPVSWFIASLSWKSLVAFLSTLNMWLRWSSSSSGGVNHLPSSPKPPCLCLHSYLFPWAVHTAGCLQTTHWWSFYNPGGSDCSATLWGKHHSFKGIDRHSCFCNLAKTTMTREDQG